MIRTSLHKPTSNARGGINIIEEFAGLSPKYKLMFCERLFMDGYDSYAKSVRTMWPNASDTDLKKLEKFLILLKNTSH